MIYDMESQFGLYFEDVEVGNIYKHWPGKTITEGESHIFSLLTMNHHPVHIDQVYARKNQHRKILVVGTYIFSIVVGLSVRDISGKAIANLNYEDITHYEPVYIGDTIFAVSEILDKRESKSKNDRGIIYIKTTAHNQEGIKVLTFHRNVLVKKKGSISE